MLCNRLLVIYFISSGVILKELHHNEIERNGTVIFMLLGELFHIAHFSSTFFSFNRQDGSEHI